MDDLGSDALETAANEERSDATRAANRRKMVNVLRVEPEFKRRQMARVLGFAGMYVALSSLVLGLFYVHILHPEVVTSRPFYMDISETGFMWKRFPGLRTTVMTWATCMIGLSSIFATTVGLHFSHKLAGPLYRFKSELLRIVDGKDFRPIVLRDGDDFQDIAFVLNEALTKLDERARNAADPSLANAALADAELDVYRDTHASMERQLERFDTDVMTNLTAEDAARVQALIDELRASLAKCETGSLA